MNKSAQDREEKGEKSSSSWNTLILRGIFPIYRMWFTNNNLLTLSIKFIDFRDIKDNISLILGIKSSLSYQKLIFSYQKLIFSY